MADKVIEIPGVGNVAFPDSMSNDDIAKAASSLHAQGLAVFKSSNEKDAAGDAVVDPNSVGTFGRHALQSFASPGQLLPFPKSMGGSGIDHPLALTSDQFAPKFLEDMKQVRLDADKRWGQGDYVGAAAKYLESALPIIGPMMSQMGDQAQSGRWAALAGDIAGLMAGGKVMGGLQSLSERGGPPTRSGPIAPNPNAAEAAAVEWGRSQGIPVDAGTATGNTFVKAVQKGADVSPIGSMIAEPARQAQMQALARTGQKLAEQASDIPSTPETAGAAVREDLTGLRRQFHTQASENYSKLRDIEAKPEFATEVQTHPVGGPAFRALQRKLASGSPSGEAPTIGEIAAMRQIQAELEMTPYRQGKWDGDAAYSGAGSGYTPGNANAAVYHQIREAAPGSSEMSGAKMARDIETALTQGTWTDASKGAFKVAQSRVNPLTGALDDQSGLGGKPLLGTTAVVQLPVNLRGVKSSLQAVYDRLSKGADVAPLMGDKAVAARALRTLLDAPDFERASIVDEALGDLKGLARASSDEVRTVGQGLVATAVKSLERAVQEAVAKAGPEATQALQEGRQNTVAKYQTTDVIDRFGENPESVQTWRRLTAPKDANVGLLSQVREMAPAAIPQVGRAFLEDLLSKATAEGGFKDAGALQRSWQNLGPQTKAMLFPDAGHVAALDKFFLLAKRLGENPNPSGTAVVSSAMKLATGGGLVLNPLATLAGLATGGALSAMLRSPAAVDILTKGLSRQAAMAKAARSPGMLADWQTAIRRAAQVAGVRGTALPAGATASQPQPEGKPR